ETEGTVSELVEADTPYVASGEINCHAADAAAARERVRAHVVGRPGVRTDDLDGLTVEHWDEGLPREDRWWFSLRSSHTESLLRRRGRHTRSKRDWSSDVCSSDLRPRARCPNWSRPIPRTSPAA